MKPIRAIVVEDHGLTRAGLRTALTSAGIDVVAEAADGIAGVDVVRRTVPDVAVVDLGLPGQDGIAVTRAVKATHGATRVVIITMQESEEQVFAALAAGADAYCVKSSDAALVIDAVRTAAAGGAFFDPRIAHAVLRRLAGETSPAGPSPLSERELDVLRLAAAGVGNIEIAKRLFLSVGTVKGHIRAILDKLSASDRTEAAVIAYRRHLLE